MQQHQPEAEKLRTQILVVSFENAAVARAYITETKITWPILIDRDRSLYRGYSMHRGGLWAIWGPSTCWAYAKELLRGRLPRYSGGDTQQLGGDVLIDPVGIVRLHHVGSGPADRPSVAAILEARQGIKSGSS